ncbi:hypothetical protein ABL975_28415 [Pseudomonas aeruginosa]|uniref:hypothetical protein n=2 Tax=Pseudomonas aeruginosa TaxID=287 RepID=UPI0012DA0676|nr:hypothetical protein [Pseudomonas aeruginosa]HCD9750518.1 hypothetical protein [Pseudomonas aeruginosa]HCF1939229.1 hypothetical protein [Pseudomonas aeruginosa]HCF1942227.1 hypothetical protein [Pseudomonas aeruginosa]HCF6243395.1 hypothetical protein [Pseudomonas aeruginosa]HCF6245957.1 hypothetical protein [Pseudomonas aeruginosa]
MLAAGKGIAKMGLSEEEDSLLCAVIAHESILCDKAYREFLYTEFRLAHGGNDVKEILLAHGAFQAFVHHLYELCIALTQRELKNIKQIKYEVADRHISVMVEKIWNVERRKSDSSLSGMTEAEFRDGYNDFSKRFRRARNNSAHALIGRARGGQSLDEFYSKYWVMLKLLFEYSTKWWRAIDVEGVNWHDIGKFNIRQIALQSVHEHLLSLGKQGLPVPSNKKESPAG